MLIIINDPPPVESSIFYKASSKPEKPHSKSYPPKLKKSSTLAAVAPKILLPVKYKIVCHVYIFTPKNYLRQKIFYPKTFFTPKRQNSFSPKTMHFLRQKVYLRKKKLLRQNCFCYVKNPIFGKKLFYVKTFLRQNFYTPFTLFCLSIFRLD